MAHSVAEFRAYLGVKSAHYTDAQIRKALELAGTQQHLGGDRLIPLPDIRQPNDYDCGRCAAQSVGTYYGVGPEKDAEWEKALGTNRRTSTHPYAIRDYLASLGLHVEASNGMTIDDLRDYWQRGYPVICPIQEWGNAVQEDKHKDQPKHGPKAEFPYGHYVAVVGLALGKVIVQDPSIDNVLDGEHADASKGLMLIDEDEFLAVRHDRDLEGDQFIRYGIAVGPPAAGVNRISQILKSHTNGASVEKGIESGKNKGKVTRDDFGFASPPAGVDSAAFAQCETCWKFTGQSCLEFRREDKVIEGGACDYYSHGRPIGAQGVGHESGGMTPEAAGYVERPVRCENCERANETATKCLFYDELNKKDKKRFALDTVVTPQSCCNAQSPKSKETVTKGWEEGKHPRGGHPENPGQFSHGAGTKPYPPPEPDKHPSFPGAPGAKSPSPDAATRQTEHRRPTPSDYARPQPATSPSSWADHSPVHKSLEQKRKMLTTDLSNGVNRAFKLRLADGTNGVFKPASGESKKSIPSIPPQTGYRREVATSRVADILGLSDLVPTTTFRTEPSDGIGSIQHFVAGAKNATEVKRDERYDGPEDARRAAALDFLLCSIDRHQNNWMLKGEKLALIDNGRAFPTYYEKREFELSAMFHMDLLRNAVVNDLDVPDLSAWRGKWDQIEKELRDCGIEDSAIQITKERYDSLMGRTSRKFADLPGFLEGYNLRRLFAEFGKRPAELEDR